MRRASRRADTVFGGAHAHIHTSDTLGGPPRFRLEDEKRGVLGAPSGEGTFPGAG